MKRIDNIQDDELRVIGRCSTGGNGRRPKTIVWTISTILGIVVLLITAIILTDKPEPKPIGEVFDPSTATILKESLADSLRLGDYSDTTGRAYTEHIERTINDIPLDIYIPHNAHPELSIGTPNINDTTTVLLTQAADIRADNGKINGAFVLAGEPKAWGLSKQGYVGIIRDSVFIGAADNSPLFEEATETGGYFFRQYALVDNGTIVENKPKNKAIRKAICERGREIFVVMSRTRESFHDFAQALVDLGVDNAVYLVGAYSESYYRDYNCRYVQIHKNSEALKHKYNNYIKWVKNEH